MDKVELSRRFIQPCKEDPDELGFHNKIVLVSKARFDSLMQQNPSLLKWILRTFLVVVFAKALDTILDALINQLEIPDFPLKGTYILGGILFTFVVVVIFETIQKLVESKPELEKIELNNPGKNKPLNRRNFIAKLSYIVVGVASVFIYQVGEDLVSRVDRSESTASETPGQASLEDQTSSSGTTTKKPQEETVQEQVPSNAEINILNMEEVSFETVTVNQYGEILRKELNTNSLWIESLNESISIEMIYIPSGTFTMGSPRTEKGRQPNEEPQHQVTIKPFLISRYPVTQEQWRYISTLPKVESNLVSDPSYFKGSLNPVERISWYESREFCARLSRATGREYRLPSEAEWEYACRAGTVTPFAFGETITTALGNYDGSVKYAEGPEGEYRQQTTQVGMFSPNAYGLFDMHGNVWEWCLDHFQESYNGVPNNGDAWLSDSENARRVIRGGSWFNYPERCRSSNRSPLAPDNRGFSEDRNSSNVGLRIVYVPEEYSRM